MLTVISGRAGRYGGGKAWWRAVAALAVAVLVPLAVVLPGPARAASGPPLVWGTAQQLEHPPWAANTSLFSVFCRTVTFCLAGDRDGNVLTSSDPTGGAAAWQSTPVAPGHVVSAIDCPAANFCAALTGGDEQLPGSLAGGIFISKNPAAGSKATWVRSNTKKTFTEGPYLACAGPALCVATDGGGGQLVASTNPASASPTWRSFTIDAKNGISGLSCPSVHLCVATDGQGDVLTSRNPAGGASAWVAKDVDGVVGMANLSCPTTSFCLAEDGSSRLIYSTDPAGRPAHWHLANEPAPLAMLTCSLAMLCAGMDYNGGLYVSADPTGGPSAWHYSDPRTDTAKEAISCPAASLCVAVDQNGNAITSTDPTAATPVWSALNADGHTGISDIDCPSAQFCAATDAHGDILTSDNPAGGPAAWTTTHLAVGVEAIALQAADISCASASFCLASTSDGVLWSTDPGGGASAWNVTDLSAAFPSFSLGTVACPTTSMCVIGASRQPSIDHTGATGILSSADPTGGPSAWQFTPLSLPHYYAPGLISCPTSKLCVAAVDNPITGSPIVTSTDPTGGASAWTTTSLAGAVTDLSCPSASLCIAGGIYNNNNGHSAPTLLLTSTDPTGGAAAWQVDGSARPLDGAIACPTASECFGFASAGNQMLTSTDPAGGASTWQESAGPLLYSTVSCPTTTMCVAANTNYGSIQLGTPPVPTKATLRLSARSIRYGHEQRERLSVTIRAQHSGTPAGRVVILAGRKTVCGLRLKAGRASCTLSARKLRHGTYRLRARYGGGGGFGPATSRPVRLRVTG